MAGQVRVAGQVIPKPSIKVSPDAQLEIDHGPKFVSRGGEKLEAAFDRFELDVSGLVCADVGASTGGFTDCLLQHGALRIYAIDVGQGILHWKLRTDPRVVVMEGMNARHIETLPEPVAFLTMDVSFISVKVLLPVIRNWFSTMGSVGRWRDKGTGGDVIILIKPQFEAGRREVARGKGVIRDPEIHRGVLQDILQTASDMGYAVRGLARSPVTGPKGNVEFLSWFKISPKKTLSSLEMDALIESVMVD